MAAPLRLGVMPVLETLPLHVALREGSFARQGLEVDVINFQSAQEGERAVLAGQLDGMISDIVSALSLLGRGVDMGIVTVSQRSMPGQPMFSLLLAPGVSLASHARLDTGISNNTIIALLLDRFRLLPELAGKTFIPVDEKRIPIRMQRLLAGELQAAVLPEPMATLAENQGATRLATDEHLDLISSVVCLSVAHRDKAGAFLRALGEAVARLNAAPDRYAGLLAATARLPAALVKDFPVYFYPMPALPSAAELASLQEWLVARGLTQASLPWERLVLLP